MRVAIANAKLTGVTTAQTLVEVVAGASQPLAVHGIYVEQPTSDTSEQLEMQVVRGDGSVAPTSTVAPSLLDPNDGTVGWQLVTAFTAASVESDVIIHSVFNTVAGFVFEARPDTAILVPAGQSLVIKLLEAPTASMDIIVRVLGIEG